MLANPGALLHQAERGSPLFVKGDHFAVENGGLRADAVLQGLQFRILAGKVVVIARRQAHFAPF